MAVYLNSLLATQSALLPGLLAASQGSRTPPEDPKNTLPARRNQPDQLVKAEHGTITEQNEKALVPATKKPYLPVLGNAGSFLISLGHSWDEFWSTPDLYYGGDKFVRHYATGNKAKAVRRMKKYAEGARGGPLSSLIEKIAVLNDPQLIPVLQHVVKHHGTNWVGDEARTVIQRLIRKALHEGYIPNDLHILNMTSDALQEWRNGGKDKSIIKMKIVIMTARDDPFDRRNAPITDLVDGLEQLNDPALIPVLEMIVLWHRDYRAGRKAAKLRLSFENRQGNKMTIAVRETRSLIHGNARLEAAYSNFRDPYENPDWAKDLPDLRDLANHAFYNWKEHRGFDAVAQFKVAITYGQHAVANKILERIQSLNEPALIPILELIAEKHSNDRVGESALAEIRRLQKEYDKEYEDIKLDRDKDWLPYLHRNPFSLVETAIHNWRGFRKKKAIRRMRILVERMSGAPLSYLIDAIEHENDPKLVPVLEYILIRHGETTYADEDIVRVRELINKYSPDLSSVLS